MTFPSSTISTFRTFGKSENLSDNFTNFSPEISTSQDWLNYYFIKFPALAGLPLLSSVACSPINDSASYSNPNSNLSSNNQTPANKLLSSLSTYSISIKSLVDCLPPINSNSSNSHLLDSLAFNFLNFSFINSNNTLYQQQHEQHQEQHQKQHQKHNKNHDQEQQFYINQTNSLNPLTDNQLNDKSTIQFTDPNINIKTLSSEAREAISNGDIFFNFHPGKPSTSASNISYITRISALDLYSTFNPSADDLINNNFFTINYPSFFFPSSNIPLSDIDLPFHFNIKYLDKNICTPLDKTFDNFLDDSTSASTSASDKSTNDKSTNANDKNNDSFNGNGTFTHLPNAFHQFLFNYRLFFHTTFRLIEFNRQDQQDLLVNFLACGDSNTDIENNHIKHIKQTSKLPKLPRSYYQIKVSFPAKVPTHTVLSTLKSYLLQHFSNARALAVIHQNTNNSHFHVHLQAAEIDLVSGNPTGKKLHFGNAKFQKLDLAWAHTYANAFGNHLLDKHLDKKLIHKIDRTHRLEVKLNQSLNHTLNPDYQEQPSHSKFTKKDKTYFLEQELRRFGHHYVYSQHQSTQRSQSQISSFHPNPGESINPQRPTASAERPTITSERPADSRPGTTSSLSSQQSQPLTTDRTINGTISGTNYTQHFPSKTDTFSRAISATTTEASQPGAAQPTQPEATKPSQPGATNTSEQSRTNGSNQQPTRTEAISRELQQHIARTDRFITISQSRLNRADTLLRESNQRSSQLQQRTSNSQQSITNSQQLIDSTTRQAQQLPDLFNQLVERTNSSHRLRDSYSRDEFDKNSLQPNDPSQSTQSKRLDRSRDDDFYPDR